MKNYNFIKKGYPFLSGLKKTHNSISDIKNNTTFAPLNERRCLDYVNYTN
ncbi:hypothetical protein [Flavobacterium sp.]